jgi:hypothetical protein
MHHLPTEKQQPGHLTLCRTACFAGINILLNKNISSFFISPATCATLLAGSVGT